MFWKGVFMKKKRGFYIFVVGCGIAFLLAGCGTNVFTSMGMVPAPTTADALSDSIDDATTAEDYQTIETAADVIIASATATDEEKKAAYVVKAEAILGANEITPLSILETVVDLSDSGADETEIFTELVASGDAKSAADAYNNAADQGDLNDNINRGVVNAVAAVNMINESFTVGEGDVELKDDTKTYFETLQEVVDPNQDGTTDDGATHYMSEANEAFDDAENLSSDQSSELGNVTDKSDALNTLYTTAATGGNYTLSDNTTVYVSSNSADDANLQTALDDIFN